MTKTVTKNSTRYITKEGERIDQICGVFYGQQAGIVEQVIIANPGLADKMPLLPAQLQIMLPDLEKDNGVKRIRLWD